MNKVALAREAVSAAARLRSEQGYAPNVGLCPFDLAQKLGISARLINVPSMEGMYSPSPKLTILVNSERPAGRRRYTCGHELGHHIFGHGYRVDELDNSNSSASSPEETLAQIFSGALLMPKLVVQSAFVRRGWQISNVTADQLFVVSQELGVGYTTLISHLEISLRLLPTSKADRFKGIALRQIRSSLAGFVPPYDVFYVDNHWLRGSVDVEVGDVIVGPQITSVEGACSEVVDRPVRHFSAVKRGSGFLVLDDGRKIPLRVSERNYVGFAKYRFMEDVEDDV